MTLIITAHITDCLPMTSKPAASRQYPQGKGHGYSRVTEEGPEARVPRTPQMVQSSGLGLESES